MRSDTLNQTNKQSASARNKKVSVVSAFSLLVLFLSILISIVFLSGPGGGGGKGGTTSDSGEGNQTGDGKGDGNSNRSESVAHQTNSTPITPEPVVNTVPFEPPVTNFILVDSTPTKPSVPVESSRGGRDAGSGGGTGGGSGTGSGAGVGEAKFMGAKAEGGSFVYIVDRSGSMGSGNRLEEAKAELMKSIDGLRREQQFFVFFYDTVSEAMPGTEYFRWATTDKKDECRNWISKITPRGGTQPEKALLSAIQMRPDVIFLMSDGQFNENVADQIKNAQGDPLVTIHTICFVDPSGERVMRRIAEENKGKYTFYPGSSGRIHTSAPLRTRQRR